MAATMLARRSTNLRNILRTINNSSNNPTTASLQSSISLPQHPRIASSRLLSRSPTIFRRELSSLLPLHSATASARLVANLSTDISASIEGRFANYVSPI